MLQEEESKAIWKDNQIKREIDRDRERDRQRQRERDRDRQKQRQRDREKEEYTYDRDIHTLGDTRRDNERETK